MKKIQEKSLSAAPRSVLYRISLLRVKENRSPIQAEPN